MELTYLGYKIKYEERENKITERFAPYTGWDVIYDEKSLLERVKLRLKNLKNKNEVKNLRVEIEKIRNDVSWIKRKTIKKYSLEEFLELETEDLPKVR